MQRDGGIRGLLSFAAVYSSFQYLVGAGRARKWLADRICQIQPHARIVDVGCGPGDAVDSLPPDAAYAGFDISEQYIRQAQERFKHRPLTVFAAGTASAMISDTRFHGADVVLCNGVLHHLDDAEVESVFRFANRALKDDGVFVAIEPCYLVHQSLASRWIMNRDRGANIRTEDEWKRIVSDGFAYSRTRVATNLLRLPYVHVVIECAKRPIALERRRPERTRPAIERGS
jgi:SAM-dependent methyltransferase